MLAVAKNELLKHFKSIKSIIIILIFVLVSYYTSKFFKTNISSLGFKDANAFYSVIRLMVFLLGYIFASTLSFNCINKEIELKTIRLVINKISKIKFFLGKFIGVALFWFLCLFISFLIISILANTFSLNIFFMILICMFYFIAIVFFLSTVIEKQSISNFMGIIFGFAIPILGLWSSISNSNFFLKVIKYIFPYYYLLNGGFYLIGPIIIGCILIVISILILNRKDL